MGSTPTESTVIEPEVVEGLVCDTSGSEFNSRQSLQIEIENVRFLEFWALLNLTMKPESTLIPNPSPQGEAGLIH